MQNDSNDGNLLVKLSSYNLIDPVCFPSEAHMDLIDNIIKISKYYKTKNIFYQYLPIFPKNYIMINLRYKHFIRSNEDLIKILQFANKQWTDEEDRTLILGHRNQKVLFTYNYNYELYHDIKYLTTKEQMASDKVILPNLNGHYLRELYQQIIDNNGIHNIKSDNMIVSDELNYTFPQLDTHKCIGFHIDMGTFIGGNILFFDPRSPYIFKYEEEPNTIDNKHPLSNIQTAIIAFARHY